MSSFFYLYIKRGQPVAVPSNVFKAFERLVLEKLHADVDPLLDK